MLGKVIESWSDKKDDWTPALVEVQESWLGPGPVEEEHEVTYAVGSRDLFAVRNERSQVASRMFDKEKQLYVYPPPTTEKAVPVSLWVPDNSLKKFDSWYFDEKIFAAVIKKEKDDLDIVLDPMDLLMYGKDDMQVLHDNPIRTYGGYDEEPKPFTLVVALAMEHKLYAGASPHSVTLVID
ncbi:hypothetical protein R6Q59_016218 [Mikania micrantha]